MIKPFLISTIVLAVIGQCHAIRYNWRVTKDKKLDELANRHFVKGTIAFFMAFIFLLVTVVLVIFQLFP